MAEVRREYGVVGLGRMGEHYRDRQAVMQLIGSRDGTKYWARAVAMMRHGREAAGRRA